MPPQKGVRRHDQPLSAPAREQPGERRDECTVRGPQGRAAGLPAEHDDLMSEHEQLDVFGELVAPAPDKQPQNSREREIGEGKKHPPILPGPTTRSTKARNLVLKPLSQETRPSLEAADRAFLAARWADCSRVGADVS
jgi:hypothetical protein